MSMTEARVPLLTQPLKIMNTRRLLGVGSPWVIVQVA